jgi:Domain of unknown function (DUF4124)
MRKIILIAFLIFGLSGFFENIFGQEFYKWVDEKGTVHFSDNPASSVLNQQKERPMENGLEVLKRSERGNRSQKTSGGKQIIIDYSQGSSGGSGGGGARTVRSGRS